MPRTTTTVCDACGQQLNDAGAMPTYALALGAFSVPNSGRITYSVAVRPPIEDAIYACGIACLWKWLHDKYPTAEQMFEKQQRHRDWQQSSQPTRTKRP